MSFLIKNARAVYAPGSPESTDIRISEGFITELGQGLLPLSGHQERIIDASNCVAYPGFVNTHHHLAQSILKGVPEGLNQGLGDWLASVPYRFWPKITPELMYQAARLGFYELLRSGTTTCADHHYLYHKNTSPEVEAAVWQAAEEMGIRFVLCRGGTTTHGSHRGMEKSAVESESLDQYLSLLEGTRTRHHDPSPIAMKRLVVAPTSLVHGSEPDHLRVMADYARSHQLKMHSHLLEVSYDDEQALAKYGMSAIDYAESCDWLGADVWFAHLVKADAHAIQKLAETGTGIGHCPTSNCRLGSGIAPVIDMVEAGVPVSIGVDGSASAESASMLQELNLSWLLHRTQHGAEATHLDRVLQWGTQGGAKILGLDGVGEVAVGKAADVVLYNIDNPRMVSVHSPLWSPLMCGEPAQVDYLFVNGKLRVEFGEVVGVDERQLVNDIRSALNELAKLGSE
ncbi:amidohydrolase family protein [Endozoicomonas atrinae]|uniref:amidohydrolase family protein n=1 Tax=Endozoicomonas atrinae TaxID=1333660 RepID=UPI00082589E6|nr:amidohydrolase family protein [Endozoicomonas atrinae]